MPINRVYPLHEVIAYVKGLGDMGRTRVTFEYVMLRGVNDSVEDARRLAELSRGEVQDQSHTLQRIALCGLQDARPGIGQAFQSYLINRHFTAIVSDSRAVDVGGRVRPAGHEVSRGGTMMSRLPVYRESFFTSQERPTACRLEMSTEGASSIRT